MEKVTFHSMRHAWASWQTQASKWRQDFAQHLRDLGVEANATERAVRGETRATKRDGIPRAILHGQSTHMRARADAVARELRLGSLKVESGKAVLLETRQAVLEGWKNLSDVLDRQGEARLAATVRRFTETMPPAWTEKERIAHLIRTQVAARRAEERALPR